MSRRMKGRITLVNAAGAERVVEDCEITIGIDPGAPGGSVGVDTVAAFLKAGEEPAPTQPLRMSIEDLLDLVGPWLGWGYGQIDDAERRIDCSSLTASAVFRLVGLTRGAEVAIASWSDLVVADSRRPWSPIERVVEAGGAETLEAGCLHVCQAWSGLDREGRFVAGVSRGHAWLWLASERDARVGWVVESTPPVGVRVTSGPRRAYSYASRPTAEELQPAPFSDRARGWSVVRVARLAEPVFHSGGDVPSDAA